MSTSGHAAGDRPFGRRRLNGGAFAAATAIAGPVDDPDLQLGRNMIELLRDVFADEMHFGAAIGTVLVFRLDRHVFLGKMVGQGTAIVVAGWAGLALAFRLLLFLLLLGGFGRADGLFHVLDAELQLIGVEPLGFGAVEGAVLLGNKSSQLIEFRNAEIALGPQGVAL